MIEKKNKISVFIRKSGLDFTKTLENLEYFVHQRNYSPDWTQIGILIHTRTLTKKKKERKNCDLFII